ncbi:MAG: ribokinase [archaeon]|nr:ribokinase [archaeon]
MKKGKVCVMGSFIVDLMMRAPKLPIPGETVKGTIFQIGPGGKGSNQGVAANRSGAETTMIAKIGNDEFADLAYNSFKNEGMTLDFIFKDDKLATGAALIMVDENSGQNKIIVTLGASNNILKENIDKAINKIKNSDVFLTQLETNLDAMEYTVNIALENNVPIILNPAPADHISDELLKKIDYLTPNESEATALCGFKVEEIDEVKKAGEYLLKKGVKNVIFTLGSKGAYLYNNEIQKLFPPFEVDVIDTTGAGDAFNGGLATALAEGKSLEEAIIFANAVGSLSVTKIGTAPAMPYREDIDKLLEKKF